MKKLLMTMGFMVVGSSAFASTSFIGDEINVGNTDAIPTITTTTINTTLDKTDAVPIVSTNTINVDASGSTLGANSGVDIGDVTVNNAAGASAVNIQDGGNSITVDSTDLDIRDLSAAQDSVQVELSTIAVTNVDGASLSVTDTNLPAISGKSLVYASSATLGATDTVILPDALIKAVELQARSNDCTYTMDGGSTVNVAKNTAESFEFDYAITGMTVELTALSGGADCRVRITGIR